MKEKGREKGVLSRSVRHNTYVQYLCSPNQSKSCKFLHIERKIRPEGSLKQCGNRLLFFEPDSRQSEEECTANSAKEPSPVVADSEIC